MELVILVVTLALMQFTWFSMQVGKARVTYGVRAPAVSGHPVFERYYRVQQNTLEQLAVFLPVIFAFAYMAEQRGWPGNEIAGALGVIWLIGRFIYANSYVRDPASRGVGFMVTFLPSAIMMLGSLILVLLSVI